MHKDHVLTKAWYAQTDRQEKRVHMNYMYILHKTTKDMRCIKLDLRCEFLSRRIR